MSFFLCYDLSACHYACLPASLTDILPLYLLLRWRCGCVTIDVERYFSADAPESKRRWGGLWPSACPVPAGLGCLVYQVGANTMGREQWGKGPFVRADHSCRYYRLLILRVGSARANEISSAIRFLLLLHLIYFRFLTTTTTLEYKKGGEFV